MENSKNKLPDLVSNPFLILVNNPKEPFRAMSIHYFLCEILNKMSNEVLIWKTDDVINFDLLSIIL